MAGDPDNESKPNNAPICFKMMTIHHIDLLKNIFKIFADAEAAEAEKTKKKSKKRDRSKKAKKRKRNDVCFYTVLVHYLLLRGRGLKLLFLELFFGD